LPDSSGHETLAYMTDLYLTESHFEAEIPILTEEQRGRKTPPYNYIRWDFGYAEDNPLQSSG